MILLSIHEKIPAKNQEFQPFSLVNWNSIRLRVIYSIF